MPAMNGWHPIASRRQGRLTRVALAILVLNGNPPSNG
jgi:hypothetical protein